MFNIETKSEAEIRQISPQVLAYIGDTIWDLAVRTHLIYTQEGTVSRLHRQAVTKVCAAAQAEAARQIEVILTDAERDILRRGRNTKSGSVPKNADAIDYRIATGFEALLGALYLSGQQERLTFIIHRLLNTHEEV